MALHAIGSRAILPDRTLLLAFDQAAGAERARLRDGGEGDRIGDRSNDFHAKVAANFAAIASGEAKRFRVIDASGGADEVTARLLAGLSDLLP